ncbi:MAG TPA: hypothetical protein ENH82_05105 [bacterium]|nr:hypothetical protein [bacterium]
MKDLAQQLENYLWADCPVPEWDFLCIEEVCDCCGKEIIRVVLSMNGVPMDVSLERQFDISDIKEREDDLESFCREIIKETVEVIEESVNGWSLENEGE